MSATYDARGLLCPLPVLRTRKLLGTLSAGQTLTITADDPLALIDIPHFCAEAGHEVLDQRPDGDAMVFVIKRGVGAP